MNKFLLFVFLAGSITYGQKRYLVTPNDDFIPLTKGQTAASIMGKRLSRNVALTSSACGNRFTFGYPTDIYPPSVNHVGRHKDVMGEWFVAKASGTIDTIFWQVYGDVGAKDSTIYVRVHNSRIGPDYGPGVRPGPYAPPCQNWGYFINTNDQDQGVAAFPEDATPPDTTTWTSTVNSGPPTKWPFLNSIWGFGGFAVTDHANSINSVAMVDGGQVLDVTVGQKFFISMRVKGPDTHPVPIDGWTSWATASFTVDNKDENYPSRNWKFYEHDSGPSNCAGVPVTLVKRGWVARGGFEDDTLSVGALDWWFTMTVTTNVPPIVRATVPIRTTFDVGPQVCEATIEDCDPENPARAGVKLAVVKWQLNGVPQTDLPMINVGGDTWDGTIPGEPVGSFVTYKVFAEDSTALTAVGAPVTYRVIQASNAYAQIDTAGPCVAKTIQTTGTLIPPSSFYVGPANTPGAPKDDGTAGPFDLGSNMPLFGDVGRYVWVGVNGAIAISKNPIDTVDVNVDGGYYTPNWTFSYPGTLRKGGRSDTAGALGRNRMPGNFIAPLWADHWYGDSVNTCGRILHQNGYAGDTCMFIVEWDSIGAFPLNGNPQCDEATFRLILNKCDGTIEYQYDDVGTLGQDTLARVGLQADSTALTVPNPGLNSQAPFIFLNEDGYPFETRPRNGWCIRISQGTISTSVAGWNMLSVGVTPPAGNYAKAALYPTATTQAFAYKGQYVAKPVLANGIGYWMKFTVGQNIGARGGLLHHVVDSVSQGWNMIGTIGFPVPKEAAIVSGTTITSQFYEYTGAYHALTTKPLTPGQGFWVKTAGSGLLTIDGNVPAAEPKNVPQTNYAELNSITIRDNAGRYQTLYLGEEGSVKEPLSFHELPPGAPEFDARFSSQRMVETYPAHLAEKATYEYPIQIDASAYPLTVTWNTVKPAERKLVLSSSDGKLGNTILDGSGSVRIANANVKSLVVKLQNIDGPKTFALGQNYPNPFNPTTRFAVEIPKLAEVNVVVYDVLGRQITTLMSGEQAAGYHTIEWDGHDARGITVPTGIYFVHMTAGEFNTTRKVMLMK